MEQYVPLLTLLTIIIFCTGVGIFIGRNFK